MPSNRAFKSRITFGVLLFTAFVSNDAFYVRLNKHNVSIDGGSSDNFTEVSRSSAGDESFLIIHEKAKASKEIVDLPTNHSTVSKTMKQDSNARKVEVDVVDNGTLKLSAIELLPKNELGRFKYSKNYTTNTQFENSVSDEFSESNAQVGAKIVYKLERREGANGAPTIEGPAAQTSDNIDIGTAYNDTIASYQSGKNEFGSLRKTEESSVTDDTGNPPTTETQLRQKERQSRLAKDWKSSIDYENTSTENPDKLKISTKGPLILTEQFRNGKHSELHIKNRNKDEVSTASSQVMPEYLTTLLSTRPYVGFTDFDISPTRIPNKTQMAKESIPESSDAFEKDKLSHKQTVTILRIDPEVFIPETNVSQIEINGYPSNIAKKSNFKNSSDEVSKKNNVTDKHVHITSKLEIIAEEETSGNTHLKIYDKGQERVNSNMTNKSLPSHIDFESPKNIFKYRDNLEEKDRSDNEERKTEKSDVTNTSRIEIATMDHYNSWKNSSFKTKHSSFTTKNVDTIKENLVYLSRNSHTIIKPHDIGQPEIEPLKVAISSSGYSPNETNSGMNENGDSDSQILRERRINDEFTSETQILPIVYAVEDSTTKLTQDANIHGNDTTQHSVKEEYHGNNKAPAKEPFDVFKIASKNTNDTENTKATNLYPVSPSYRRFKKLDISSPKPFRRDPNDNTWRNQSISSLGIVFKAKANASKPLSAVLKNKTETDSGVINGKEIRTELELRQRLEKLSELRKLKKKFIRPTVEKYKDKTTDYVTSTPVFGTTETTTTDPRIDTSTVGNTYTTSAGTTYPGYIDSVVFTVTPQPLTVATQGEPQRVVLIVKKGNDEKFMYYDAVETVTQSDEFIPWTIWDAEKAPQHGEHLRPGALHPPVRYYLPPEQRQKHHDAFEERLYTAVDVVETNSLRKRSKNSIVRWPPADVRDGENFVSSPRPPAAAVSLIRRGDDYGEVSYAINHDAPPAIGRRARPERNQPQRFRAAAVQFPRGLRNDEDYDYHDRLQMTDLEKFSYTYNSERFMGDVPILFDTSVVRVDAAPYRQHFTGRNESAPSTSTESGVEITAQAAPASRLATTSEQPMPPLRSYEVSPFGTFLFGQDDE